MKCIVCDIDNLDTCDCIYRLEEVGNDVAQYMYYNYVRIMKGE